MSSKTFLKSHWLRLVSVNYIIDPQVLKNHLPKGTVLEAHNGQYFVSLVAFRYSKTKLYNLQIPFHSTFEEVNLRFYVKRKISQNQWRSEVAFTKLFFPKRTLTMVAKKVYKENYETVPMKHHWSEDNRDLFTSYGLKKTKWQEIEVVSEKNSRNVIPSSSEFFFSKQYWGTSQVDEKSCTIYRIEHKPWKSFRVKNWKINFDFNEVFGREFKHLSSSKPDSVHLFDGSEVLVHKKKIL